MVLRWVWPIEKSYSARVELEYPFFCWDQDELIELKRKVRLWKRLENVIFGAESHLGRVIIDTDEGFIALNKNIVIEDDHCLIILIFDTSEPIKEFCIFGRLRSQGNLLLYQLFEERLLGFEVANAKWRHSHFNL